MIGLSLSLMSFSRRVLLFGFILVDLLIYALDVIMIFGMHGYTFGYWKKGECERGHLKDSAHSKFRSIANAKSEGGCQHVKPSALPFGSRSAHLP